MSMATKSGGAVRQRSVNINGKRTNSLGWAKADCHTCASLSRACDRRRPRCSPCLADGGICAGYVQELNWERGKARNGAKRQRLSPTEDVPDVPSESRLPQPAEFVFVDTAAQQQGRTRNRRRRLSKSSTATSVSCNVSEISNGDVDAADVEYAAERSPSESSVWSVVPASASPSGFHFNAALTELFPLLPKIHRLPGSIEDALAFYHSTFSYVSLTFDVPINPWQSALPAVHESLPCVRYAAVAVAQRQQAHLAGQPESLAVLRLKDRALGLFAAHLGGLSVAAGMSTCLLLIALDLAESGFANWTIHLRGAFRILEAAGDGGAAGAVSRPALRSQLAQLLWYDIQASLVSRCGPVFPRRYVDALMAARGAGEWTMLALNGLPDSMFRDMYDLSVAAAWPELMAQDELEAMEERILQGEVERVVGGEAKVAVLAECWRLGLLLYCARVFHHHHRKRGREFFYTSNFPPEVDLYERTREIAEQILAFLQSLPETSHFQKQCLMPAILAGCEIEDEAGRKVAADFCKRWKAITGMWIFESCREFMSLVWERIDSEKTCRASTTECSNDGTDITGDDDELIGASQGYIRPGWTDVFPAGVEQNFILG